MFSLQKNIVRRKTSSHRSPVALVTKSPGASQPQWYKTYMVLSILSEFFPFAGAACLLLF